MFVDTDAMTAAELATLIAELEARGALTPIERDLLSYARLDLLSRSELDRAGRDADPAERPA